MSDKDILEMLISYLKSMIKHYKEARDETYELSLKSHYQDNLVIYSQIYDYIFELKNEGRNRR